MVYFYTFASVALISLLSLVGIFLMILKPQKLSELVMFLVSLSIGTMLGDAILHLLPEVAATGNGQLAPWLWLLGGMVAFFLLEKGVHWHHCHSPEECEHEKTLGVMNLVGDGLHNFIDGAVIAGTYLISVPLGLATTLAVVAHEIPQEIGDLGVLLHAGYSKGHALALNLGSALLAFLGAGLTLLLSRQIDNLNAFVIPFTAGGFIYIAAADLIPELKKHPAIRKTIEQTIGILLGISIMYLLTKLDN